MKALIVLLVIALAVTFVLDVFFGVDPQQRQPEALTEMAYSLAAEAQRPNQFLPGGVTQQLPPDGTIPAGFPPLEYEPGDSGRVQAGRELKNPFQPTAENVGRGQFVFQTWCTPCHGLDGMGHGRVALKGFPPPPPLAGETAKPLPDGEIFHIVTNGFNNMPAHGSQVRRDDRWKAALYLKSIRGAQQ